MLLGVSYVSITIAQLPKTMNFFIIQDGDRISLQAFSPKKIFLSKISDKYPHLFCLHEIRIDTHESLDWSDISICGEWLAEI